LVGVVGVGVFVVGAGGLPDLLVGFAAPGLGGFDHAAGHVLIEQTQGDGLQGLRGGTDLGEDVDAVLVVLDHLLQPPDLPLHPAQPLEVVVLVCGVAVHVASWAHCRHLSRRSPLYHTPVLYIPLAYGTPVR